MTTLINRSQFEAYLVASFTDLKIVRLPDINNAQPYYCLQILPTGVMEWKTHAHTRHRHQVRQHKTAEPCIKFLESHGIKQCRIEWV